ncbi:MAG: hypothetical protein CMJ48_09435, partial [Planctomycetaceae bacterium]|nr:hypothetical protein [Planctomycetaceae bacterium]
MEALRTWIKKDHDVHFVLVMVDSDDNASAHEHRLRARYAVMSALRSRSYIPDHKNEVQALDSRAYETKPARADKHDTSAKLPASTSDVSRVESGSLRSSPVKRSESEGVHAGRVPLMAYTVYEAFSKDVGESRVADTEGSQAFVLWLPDGQFKERESLSRLRTLARNLRHEAKEAGASDKTRVSLIGPNSSDILEPIADKVAGGRKAHSKEGEEEEEGVKDEGVNVYSATATAPFVEANAEALDHDQFKTFERVIGSDARLCTAFVKELRRRGIDPVGDRTDHVLLVADWNSYFTRTLPETFREELVGRPTGDEKSPSNLHVFSFASGIDGDVSDGAERPKSQREPKVESGGGAPASARSTMTGLGEHRLDYLRRFADALRHEVTADGGQVRAIGVFAKDAYDRLQIMHSLKEEFPNAMFFTNDLDVRFAAKENLRFTRNLIVASHFGLRLSKKYQMGPNGQWVPPFRDTYQTARYFACLMALDGRTRLSSEEKEGIDSPRLFEIGNGQIIDLSVEPGMIHPRRRSTPVRGSEIAVPASAIVVTLQYGVVGCVAMLLLASVSKTVADRFRRSAKDWALTYAFWTVVVSTALLGVVIGYDHFLNPEGEYWSLTAGTSIWVSVVVQYAAVVVAAYFLMRGKKAMEADNAMAEDEFVLRSRVTCEEAVPMGLFKWIWRFCTFDGLRTVFDDADGSESDESGTNCVSVRKLWGACGCERARSGRHRSSSACRQGPSAALR